ncbi:hypothetical protein RB653_005282 [Dictyostelium firmibasis]|uniref:UBR-type domain-containing protein n=1 Tax=Dictyostelium firmibasis TaxID=79012 RepID=A0AAN7YSU5_9MYCE
MDNEKVAESVSLKKEFFETKESLNVESTTTVTATATTATTGKLKNSIKTTMTTTTTTTTQPNIIGVKRRSDDEIISIQDALNDQLEEEKNLLEEAKEQEQEDWGDESICTFDKGYINQSVFACKTCQLTNDKLFGFCYGCSMHCHLYHDVYELFNKRDFRCDCGTKVQEPNNNFKCQLSEISINKEGSTTATATTTTTTTTITDLNNIDIGSYDKRQILNEKNHYNHNFKGRYCYCDSPYDYKEDMIQCIFCEDWFHENCLKLNSNVLDIPSPGEFADLICADCLSKNQFLLLYPHIRCYIENDHIIIDDPPPSKLNIHNNSNNCKVEGAVISNKKNDLFCKESWREELCYCLKCKEIYKEKNVEFLFEKEEPSKKNKIIDETVNNKNEKGKSVDVFEMGQDVFSKTLEPTQQRALIEGFSDMKEKLKELFSKKLDKNQVVTKQDIQSFFVDLNVNKKFKK